MKLDAARSVPRGRTGPPAILPISRKLPGSTIAASRARVHLAAAVLARDLLFAAHLFGHRAPRGKLVDFLFQLMPIRLAYVDETSFRFFAHATTVAR